MTLESLPRLAALAAVALLLAPAARAEPVVLTFEQAIYVAANDSKLKEPEGVACSASALVVADTGNGRLLTFPVKDGRPGLPAEAKVAQLAYPQQVQLDSKGNILALDGKTHRIVKLTPAGAFTGVVEPKGAGGGAAPVPAGFKLDAADNLYVLDVAGRRVVVADANGTITRQLELPKQGLFTDVAVDPSGTIYVVDAVGAVVWSAGKADQAFKALTKSMSDRMSFPTYASVSRGKLFLVDQHGNGVVVLGLDGAFLGRQLSIGWNDGLVYYPSQLCVSEAGQVFVADRYNNRVQQFSLPR